MVLNFLEADTEAPIDSSSAMDPRSFGLSFLYKQCDVHKPDAGIVYSRDGGKTHTTNVVIEDDFETRNEEKCKKKCEFYFFKPLVEWYIVQ